MTVRPVCKAAQDLIKSFEQCELVAYADGGGTWTIGWGHTGKEVHEGMVISQDVADHLFDTDISQFSKYVGYYVTATVNDNQFGALVSFAYNAGLVNLTKVAKYLNAGDFAGGLVELKRHVTDRMGKVENGLVRRRNAEAVLFMKRPSR